MNTDRFNLERGWSCCLNIKKVEEKFKSNVSCLLVFTTTVLAKRTLYNVVHSPMTYPIHAHALYVACINLIIINCLLEEPAHKMFVNYRVLLFVHLFIYPGLFDCWDKKE